MEKVFLLLRNNLQTGPFTLDELRLQCLSPSDLIWIEGQCQSWMTPSEFEDWQLSRKVELASSQKPTTLGKVDGDFSVGTQKSARDSASPQWYISQEKQLERRAEELRKEVLSAPASSSLIERELRRQQNRSTSKPAMSDDTDDIELVFHQKQPSITASHLVVICFVVLVVVGGWKKGWTPLKSRGDLVTSVALPYKQNSQGFTRCSFFFRTSSDT